ncbi:AzlC family ABC transporter permease [Arenibaculum pallidiluteum]|uniref:AzlC family ABC transporter permease n=1 Tax=Arenibaculum pallidiluteum TaxID=2812559 RepID=UPI001F2B658B|nr:AzlC family ABC transporter permease [Arenibaculum pallidiluteum]
MGKLRRMLVDASHPMTHETPPSSPVEDLRAGFIQILPLTIACVPFGLILGANAAAKGLSVIEVTLMSALVFAGSAQFVAIDLWQDPAPWAALGLTVLLVNLRHVLMGASLAGKLDRFGTLGRSIAVFFMADEIWAVAERRAIERGLTPAFYLGAAAPLYLNWLVTTTIGAAVGALVADPRALGFDFAFTAVFIGLVAGFWKGRSSLPVVVASAAAAIAVRHAVPGGWFVVAGALAGIGVAALRAGDAETGGGKAVLRAEADRSSTP